jgi:hypothetical protein
VGQDSQRELQELTSVHSFYVGLLEKSLGHAVPFPAEVRNPDASPENIARTLESFMSWLDVLDLAMTPPIVRDALKPVSTTETAFALLRYYVTKASPRSGDRDKTDCVITHLFRNPPQADGAPPSWQRPEVDSSQYFVSQAALGFQGELYRVLQGVQCSPVAPEQAQILQEFEYLYQELSDFRHFDQIMDSGMVQRVRELKQSLGKAFYHPDALAQLAVWNDVFGRKFDELFHDAAKQIKTFAENVQKEGASILSRLEGDITVKQLAEMRANEILSEDYQSAQDEFRKVSKYKKVVDSKRLARVAGAGQFSPTPPQAPPIPRAQIPTADAVPPVASSYTAPPPPPSPPRPHTNSPQQQIKAEVLAVPPSQAVQNAVQEGKIHSAKESIKEHVRGVDPRQAFIVPIKNTKITLSAAEVEAFKADYQGEKSFRADYANVMMNIVSYLSRMIVEVDEYNQKATSAYLWKPHADALGYLLTTFERLRMEAESVMAVARGRGLQDKGAALQSSLDKLSEYAKTVSQTLQASNQSARQ